MSAKPSSNIIKFPKKGRSRAFNHYECKVCGFPSSTYRGRETHFRMCHTASEKADRNWEIFYLHMEAYTSIERLSKDYNLSPASIRRIIFRGLAFPGIYELEEQ